MDQKDKLNKYTDEQKNKIIFDYLKDSYSFELHFVINGKPVPYARARAGRHGFYNPKAAIEAQYKKLFKEQLSMDEYKKLKSLMEENHEYYVSIDGVFYVPIATTDSVKETILKESGVLKPSIRNGDIDNYMKLVLDALHDVIYTDDKCVTNISADKLYSINPRSEIIVKITVIK